MPKPANMSREATLQLISQATAAIHDGKYSEALRFLESVKVAETSPSDLNFLRGITLAQLGKAEAATESFRAAITESNAPIIAVNFAAHLHNIGEFAEAEVVVKKALDLHPESAPLSELLTVVSSADGLLRFSVGGQLIDPTPLASKRRYGYGRKHLFSSIAENQDQWVKLGWAIVGVSVLAAILAKLFFPLVAPSHIDPKNPLLGYKPSGSVSAFAVIALFLTSILASMVWTSVDLIDRRGKALWMIPMMLCCFMFVPFVPQSLYMAIGRRNLNPKG